MAHNYSEDSQQHPDKKKKITMILFIFFDLYIILTKAKIRKNG